MDRRHCRTVRILSAVFQSKVDHPRPILHLSNRSMAIKMVLQVRMVQSRLLGTIHPFHMDQMVLMDLVTAICEHRHLGRWAEYLHLGRQARTIHQVPQDLLHNGDRTTIVAMGTISERHHLGHRAKHQSTDQDRHIRVDQAVTSQGLTTDDLIIQTANGPIPMIEVGMPFLLLSKGNKTIHHQQKPPPPKAKRTCSMILMTTHQVSYRACVV
mmetsp:Transcript_23414/g.34942  ORF Transcript_23414/g.34942 Transcript_23414/m.34942 type:complete len:212 (-) Transcript_23414:122-757(-)